MKPGNRSLKFGVLAALQALCVFIPVCASLLPSAAQGKRWWRDEDANFLFVFSLHKGAMRKSTLLCYLQIENNLGTVCFFWASWLRNSYFILYSVTLILLILHSRLPLAGWVHRVLFQYARQTQVWHMFTPPVEVHLPNSRVPFGSLQ